MIHLKKQRARMLFVCLVLAVFLGASNASESVLNKTHAAIEGNNARNIMRLVQRSIDIVEGVEGSLKKNGQEMQPIRTAHLADWVNQARNAVWEIDNQAKLDSGITLILCSQRLQEVVRKLIFDCYFSDFSKVLYKADPKYTLDLFKKIESGFLDDSSSRLSHLLSEENNILYEICYFVNDFKVKEPNKIFQLQDPYFCIIYCADYINKKVSDAIAYLDYKKIFYKDIGARLKELMEADNSALNLMNCIFIYECLWCKPNLNPIPIESYITGMSLEEQARFGNILALIIISYAEDDWVNVVEFERLRIHKYILEQRENKDTIRPNIYILEDCDFDCDCDCRSWDLCAVTQKLKELEEQYSKKKLENEIESLEKNLEETQNKISEIINKTKEEKEEIGADLLEELQDEKRTLEEDIINRVCIIQKKNLESSLDIPEPTIDALGYIFDFFIKPNTNLKINRIIIKLHPLILALKKEKIKISQYLPKRGFRYDPKLKRLETVLFLEKGLSMNVDDESTDFSRNADFLNSLYLANCSYIPIDGIEEKKEKLEEIFKTFLPDKNIFFVTQEKIDDLESYHERSVFL